MAVLASALAIVCLGRSHAFAGPVPTRVEPPVTLACPEYDPAALPAPLPRQVRRDDVGAVHGRFAVASTGAAHYTVPVDVPPGRAGIQPALSVSYDSDRGDGPLGVGFQLEGLSIIERCARTIADDGIVGAVTFDDATDRLCLDGARLVATDGEYGAEGTVYRTVPDTFVRVRGHGLSWFEVEAPTGHVSSYGTTDNSRAVIFGERARAWALDRVRDSSGNFMTVSYVNFRAGEDRSYTAEMWPDGIDYTGHDSGASPNRHVRFAWEDRPDAHAGFLNGLRMTRTRRLASIVSSVDGTDVRVLGFSYVQSGVSGRSLLSTIEETAGGDRKTPTTFDWSRGTEGVSFDAEHLFQTAPSALPPPNATTSQILHADLNGDGLDDLVYADLGSEAGQPINVWKVALSGGPGGALSAPQVWAKTPQPLCPDCTAGPAMDFAIPLDFDRDGRMDLLTLNNRVPNSMITPSIDHKVQWGEGGWKVLRSTGSGFQVLDSGVFVPSGSEVKRRVPLVGDFDGDGVTDVLPCTSTGAVFGCQNEAVPWTLDVNGDGVLDVILPPEAWRPEYQAWTYVTKTWTQIPLGLPSDAFPTITTYVGGGAGPGAQGFVKVPASMAFADVNGDGLRDIVRGPPPAGPDGPLLVFLNTGAGFLPAQPLSVGGSMSFLDFNIASVFDADGDGRDDFLVPASFSDGYEYALVRSVPASSASPTDDGLAYEVQRTHIPAVFPSYANDFDSFQAFAPGRAPRPMNIEGFGSFGFVALGAPDSFGAPTRLEHHRSILRMPDLLVQVHDGLATTAGGRPRVAIEYGPAVRTVSSPYSPAPAVALPYPAHRFVGPKRLVASYKEDNGNDDLGVGLSQNETTLRYEDARLALNGRGWLGFARRTETLRTPDGRRRRRTVSEVDNATYDVATKSFPFVGVAKRTATYLGLPTAAPNTVPQTYELLLEESSPEVKVSAAGKSHFVVVTSRRSRHWQLPGPAPADTVAPVAEPLEDEVLETQVDGFGNPTSTKKSVQGQLVEEVTNIFDNDPSNIPAAAPWRLRQLRQTTVTDYADDGSSASRVLAHEYDALGRIARTIRAPGDPALELSLAITRDAYGNVVVASTTPAVGTARQSCTTFDPDGVFPHATRNAEGHVVRSRTDPALGVVTDEMDPNGLVTQTAYDAFGRIALRVHPDGTATSVSLSRQLETTGGDYRTRVEVSSPDGQHTLAMHDSLGRAFRTWRWVMGPSGTPEYVREERRFDALGRVVAQSVPAPETVAAGALKFGRVRYDDAGRPVRYLPISGGDTIVEYVGRDTRTLRGKTFEQVTVSSRDARGRLTQVLDAMGGTTTYRYGPFGVLREVESPNGSKRSFATDPYGRVTSLVDPDMGAQVYELDGFDQVVAETDGNGLRSEYTYDRLGRRTRRVDPAGETIFSWDGAPNGIGALHETLSPDGIRQSATYDSLSRPATTTTTIGDESFVTSFSYNEVGQLSRIDYPSDVGAFSVAYGYDPHGELVRVSGPGNESYWRKAAGDYTGRTATELFGNGLRTDRTYQPDTGRVLTIRTGGLRPGEPNNVSIQRLSYRYDATLNLATRTDHRQLAANGVEVFTYDNLNRVTAVLDGEADNGGAARYAYAYDAAGNITSKSDVGAFGYEGTPHAVTQAGAETLTYDGNGNLVQRTTGVTSRSFVYTPFNLPSAVTGAGLGGGVHFKYDAHQQRVVKRRGADTTIYVGQHYERTTRPTVTTARYFVRTPERVIAVVGRTVTPPTSDGGPQIKEAVQFLHTDHNGSVDVVTDGSGAVLERRSYDPFGARRRGQNWSSPSAPDKRVTVVGFTGHMDEDDLGLVNMRGRLYDPKLGRFTTPDPFVLRPHGAQGWNRYSYVQNNPGSWIDPSGFGECQIKCSDAAPAPSSKDGGHGDTRNQGPAGACWVVCGGNPPQPGGSRVPTGGGGISLGGGGSSGPPPPPGPRPNGTAPPPVVRATPTSTPPITPRVEHGYSFEDTDTYINVYGTKAALFTGGGALLVAGAIGGFVLFEAGALAAAGAWLAGAVAGVTARLGALVAPLMTPQVAVPVGTAAATAGAAAMHFGPQLPSAWNMMSAVGSRLPTFSWGNYAGQVQSASPQQYDIIPYSRSAPGFEKHHGVLDAWARVHIPGYTSGGAPTVVLTPAQHNITRGIFNSWRAQNGWSRSPVPWLDVTQQQIQALTYRMFDGAGVPADVVDAYIGAFQHYVSGGGH